MSEAAKGAIPSGEQWLTELVAFSIPGVAIGLASSRKNPKLTQLRTTLGAQNRPDLKPENLSAANSQIANIPLIDSKQTPDDVRTAPKNVPTEARGDLARALVKVAMGTPMIRPDPNRPAEPEEVLELLLQSASNLDQESRQAMKREPEIIYLEEKMRMEQPMPALN